MSGNPADPYYQSPHWHTLRDACLARDHRRCTVVGCRSRGVVADHIVTRPPVPYPTPQDCLENLRTLCRSHDSQVKEPRRGGGERKQGGVFRVKGCDVDGWPLSPQHRR